MKKIDSIIVHTAISAGMTALIFFWLYRSEKVAGGT